MLALINTLIKAFFFQTSLLFDVFESRGSQIRFIIKYIKCVSKSDTEEKITLSNCEQHKLNISHLSSARRISS